MTKPKAYATTDVPVDQSQNELRTLLRKFGVDQYTFAEGRVFAGVELVHDAQVVRLRCPIHPPTDEDVRKWRSASHKPEADCLAALSERELMRIWRVLVWSVKARLVAVEEGLETFEQAFLAHLVDPGTDRTLWEAVREPIEAGRMRLGGPGLLAITTGGADG